MYLPTYRSRLQRAHRYITKKLKALGISFLNRGSGLYVWINLKVVSSGNEARYSWAGLPAASLAQLCPSAFPSTWIRAPLRKSGCSIAASWTTS